jgi:oxaloacetate decarboxylase alpha subunit
MIDLPGGMTGTLKAQLAQHGMQERLNEVLEETVRVREEMAHPFPRQPLRRTAAARNDVG